MSDTYHTIAEPADAEIKILGSRFIGYALPVSSTEEFQTLLAALKKEHYSATHHCYAYRLGFDGSEFRFSDDGEPNGTAGKRILGSIDKFGCTNTAVVVVRYFGGTKLGVGGLSHAYSDSADAVLNVANIEERFLRRRYELAFPYDVTSHVHHDIERYNVEVVNRIYTDAVAYEVIIRDSLFEQFSRDVTEHSQRTVLFTRLADPPL